VPGTSLDSLFKPKSIAIVGASDKSDRIGFQVIKSLKVGKFQGAIYPVNPRIKTVLELPVFTSIESIPGDVDLAIIGLRKDRVLEAINACGHKGVQFVIVMSSGFSELGEDALEQALVEQVHHYGMRMLGPNCAGFASTWDGIYASFENRLKKGHLAFISQSGAMCAVILALARTVGLGFSIFVSYGNQADIGPEEILQFLDTHTPTKLIGWYLEGITDARQFISIAKSITHHKPLVVLKPGKTPQATYAIRSHTGTMAGEQAIYTGAFRQAGILQATNLDEFIDACQILVTQPLPKGNRVGIITNSGGPGVLAVDACAQMRLAVPPFSASLITQLEEDLPPFCPLRNPVDLGPEGTPETYQRISELLLNDAELDMVLILCVPTAFSSIQSITKSVIAAKKANPQKPLVTCWLADDIVEEGLPLLIKAGIPNFPTPQRAAKALQFLHYRAEWLRSH
jgi:acetyl-CoA synthetase (ADP-forming)